MTLIMPADRRPLCGTLCAYPASLPHPGFSPP
jgi:hypothetical protein